jgi:hypothetical protein
MQCSALDSSDTLQRSFRVVNPRLLRQRGFVSEKEVVSIGEVHVLDLLRKHRPSQLGISTTLSTLDGDPFPLDSTE